MIDELARSFRGLPPTGRGVELVGMEKHRVEGGRLRRTDVHLDGEAFREQLGLTFPAVVWQLPALARGAIRARL